MKTELSRKVGIEMEGYLETHPHGIELKSAKIGMDSSLENCDWEYDDEPYGVEIRTDPLTNLDVLEEMWSDMRFYGWDVGEEAGTHIHVDISDFSTYEMVKLLRFGKGIEDIMFSFVRNYRHDSEYCEFLDNQYNNIFTAEKYQDIDWDTITKRNYNNFICNKGFYDIQNYKYNWMNVIESRYPTVEFRLFHAVEDMNELMKQALTAEAIVNLVKYSTLEQLEFMLKDLYSSKADKITSKFFEMLGLDFELQLHGTRAFKQLCARLNENEAELVV